MHHIGCITFAFYTPFKYLTIDHSFQITHKNSQNDQFTTTITALFRTFVCFLGYLYLKSII